MTALSSTSSTPSKTRTSFYRRLYVAWLIEQNIASVPAITSLSGMPRRTAQDTIHALHELDIRCRFHQTEGERQNQGSYAIESWGAINPSWVHQHIGEIAALLGYPLPASV
ncbi:helix-turn-helix domain-containing protein [Carnimonas nigrificans]|uniref:helix-turn-helix domain-containing protein n=1 Tax=Carnimonas nigrificans TaxID=64323 RepID=UPI0004713BE0|nr:helix-turn-helix domain-containing protein [Carnimonas nigrificans]